MSKTNNAEISQLIKLDKEEAKSLIYQIISEDPNDVQLGILNLVNMDYSCLNTKSWVSYIIWVAKGYPIHIKEDNKNEITKCNIITALKSILNKKQQKEISKLCYNFDITKSSSDEDIASEMTGEWLLERINNCPDHHNMMLEYVNVFFNVIIKETKKSGYIPENAEINITLKQ